MGSERLRSLHEAGQSVWLDYIDRTMLRNGDLARRIEEEHLTGMTSNPTIFEKALSEGSAYDPQISAVLDLPPAELFELLETDDVRAACDIFAEMYRSTGGRDGHVSIEVSPSLARDASGTVAEGLRLWRTVARPNLMVKVPGTVEGADAVEQLISAGVNVNVTLLFSVDAHLRVMEAYVRGLEQRSAAGKEVAGINSVASFFISRVDSEVDRRLDELAASGAIDAEVAAGMKGRAAIANARLAYNAFRTFFSGSRWEKLAAAGARVQRPLWASTSTKNPAYRDVVYVEQLIGPDTVNTMPPATIRAFADHGDVARTIDAGVAQAAADIGRLGELGISLSAVTDKLLVDGLASFQKSFDTLITGLETKASLLRGHLQASH